MGRAELPNSTFYSYCLIERRRRIDDVKRIDSATQFGAEETQIRDDRLDQGQFYYVVFFLFWLFMIVFGGVCVVERTFSHLFTLIRSRLIWFDLTSFFG